MANMFTYTKRFDRISSRKGNTRNFIISTSVCGWAEWARWLALVMGHWMIEMLILEWHNKWNFAICATYWVPQWVRIFSLISLSEVDMRSCRFNMAAGAPRNTRCQFHMYGPLTRYVKSRVAHAPGMPGTFPPAAEFKGKHELAIPACITTRASRTCRDACRDCLPAVAGKTFPAFPAHAHPQFDVFGKRPMAKQSRSQNVCLQ